MATIHQLAHSTAKRASSPTSTTARPQPADIILFPGVRYERWAEAHTQVRPKRERKRDRLEICD